MQIQSSQKQKLSTIRVATPDSDDGQIWIQSTISATHKLTRGLKDDFSFTATDLLLITNRGGGSATCIVEGFACAESGIFIGSNRRGGLALREGERRKILMRPGEVLSVRSVDAYEPGSKQPDGSHVRIRAGQNVTPEA